MKVLIALSLISLPAFADTFADREKALQNRQLDQLVVESQKAVLARNQDFLAKLRQVIDAHKGLKAAVRCDSEGAENSVANDPAKDLEYVLAGHGLQIGVRYAPNDDSRGFVSDMQIRRYLVQPEPANCSIELRDGSACEVGIEADENGGSDDVHFEATCISASLKKTRQNLGKILR